jgi:hypothetical protein
MGHGAMRCGNWARIATLGLALSWLFAAFSAEAASFAVAFAESKQSDEHYVVNATIDLELSEETIEALRNGVAISVDIDMRAMLERKILWDERVADSIIERELRYHALSNLFIVRTVGERRSQTFRSLSTALLALGTVREAPLVPIDALQDDIVYYFEIRARLDIESLPAPLRPLAYLNPNWHHQSNWHRWTPKP